MTYIATAAISFIIGFAAGYCANAYLSKKEREQDTFREHSLSETPPEGWNPEVTWRGYDKHGNYRGN